MSITVGKNPIEEMEQLLKSTRESKMQVPGCNFKNDRMISVCFQGKPFNMRVIQVYVPATNTKEAEVNQFYEDLEDLLGITAKKKKKMFCSSLGIGMQKQEIKRNLQQKASLVLEKKVKQDNG